MDERTKKLCGIFFCLIMLAAPLEWLREREMKKDITHPTEVRKIIADSSVVRNTFDTVRGNRGK